MYTFKVPKMSCGGCVNTIKKAILHVDEAAIIEIDLPTRTVSIQTNLPEETIFNAISDTGYQPTH